LGLALTLARAAGTVDENSHRVLWRAPRAMTTEDWIYGPGGQSRAPVPPFHFLGAVLTGWSPKVTVRDSKGSTWSVKFGGEVIPECFGSRMLNALGYVTEPTYFVHQGFIEDAGPLPARIRHSFKEDGSFARARFELRGLKDLEFLRRHVWAWNNNPFTGTHELAGLKIMMMLLSNWDAMDAREGDYSNCGVFRSTVSGTPLLLYSVYDWGASLGKWGNSLRRTKSDCAGFAADTPHFVKGIRNGYVEWGYSGKHADDVTAGITAADVRWLLLYLRRITPEEISIGLTASGATSRQSYCWTRSILERIQQLEAIR
jgi:hypothetical protein